VKHRARNRGSKRTGTLGICVQVCGVVRCVSGVCAPRAWRLREMLDTENEKRREKVEIFRFLQGLQVHDDLTLNRHFWV
jgi:hypothetical protein